MLVYFKTLEIKNVISFFALWVGVNLVMANDFVLENVLNNIPYSLFLPLGIILFSSGSFLLLKNWAESNRKTEVFDNFKNIILPLIICLFVLVPDYFSLLSLANIPDAWQTLYYLFSTFIIVIYLIDQYFCFLNLIINEGKQSSIKVFNALHWFLLAGLLFLFVPKEYEFWLYFPYLSTGLIITIYIGTRLSWVGKIENDRKWYLAGFLLIVNLLNLFIIMHYSLRIEEYFFEIKFYPFAPFFLLLLFVSILSFGSLISLLFYIPISETVELKSNEIDRLIRIGNLGRNQTQNIELYQYLLKAAVEDCSASHGWFNFEDEAESSLQAKNISSDTIEKIESKLHYRLEEAYWERKYFEITSESHPHFFTDELANASALISFNYNIDYKEVGRLYLIRFDKNTFSYDNIHLVRSYLKQARLSYQSRLLVDKQVEAKRVEEEFKQAKVIQQKLLPQYNIVDDTVDFNAFLYPSRELGGDFYDLFKLDQDRILIIMGDVAGKGLTASLYMAELKGIFQTLSTFDLSPKEFIYKINKVVNSCFESKVFVTLTYLLVNKKEKSYTYSRAGQCPILYYKAKNKTTEYFDDEGVGIGIIKDKHFEEKIKVYKHFYEKDDLILLFSDGISEARNERDELFGLSGIESAIHEASKENAQVINDFIHRKIREHTLKNPDQDDLTSLVIRFK